jgi:hypothetical protein
MCGGIVSDALSGAGNLMENVGNVVTSPLKWGGDIIEKAGSMAGINELENIGRTTHDITVDPTVQRLAGPAATAYAAPIGYASMFPEAGAAAGAGASSMLPTGAASLGEFPLEFAGDLTGGGLVYGSPEYLAALPEGLAFPEMTAADYLAGDSTIWGGAEGLLNTAVPGVSGSGALSNFAKGGVGKVAGNSSLFPWLLGGGTIANTLSNYLGGKRQEEAAKDYLAASTWNPDTRAKYMTGAKGEISNWLTGKQGLTASNAASLGRGGGFYGNKLNQNMNKATEALASALAETYKPSTAPYSAYEGLKSPSLLESAVGGASSSLLPAWLLSSFL